jgi:hypothetical protein
MVCGIGKENRQEGCALVLALAVALAGCGSSKENGADGGLNGEAAFEATADAAGDAAGADNVRPGDGLEQDSRLVPDVSEGRARPDQDSSGPQDVDGEAEAWVSDAADLPDQSLADPGQEAPPAEGGGSEAQDGYPETLGEMGPPADGGSKPACLADSDCGELSALDKCKGPAVCIEGKCKFDPALAVVCPATGYQCLANKCDPGTGECLQLPEADGVFCDDGVEETLLDICTGGLCLGTNVAACEKDSDCNDSYPCTMDACQGGECAYSAVVCQPQQPENCKFSVCLESGACQEKKYNVDDPLIYEESFEDGLAEGWKTAGKGYAFLVQQAPSGDRGLAVSLAAGFSAEVAPPPIYLPTSTGLLAIGVELSNPALCKGVKLELVAEGEVFATADTCGFGPEQLTMGFGLPTGLVGDVALGLKVTNEGAVTAKVVITRFMLYAQGGEACCADLDQDKVWDCIDNCVGLHNPGQEDCDGDLVGDLCDGDSDDDGTENKYDYFPCDPGADLAVRRVAVRELAPLVPVAVACSEAQGICFVLDLEGRHMIMDKYGTPSRMITLEQVGLARSATVCSDMLWVVDATSSVFGYDIQDPSRPEFLYTFPIPTDLFSLNQSIACHDGDLLLSAGHAVYVFEVGGEADLFYDVLEELWGSETSDDDLWALTRSPQPPYLFLLRWIDTVGAIQKIFNMKSDPTELEPTCVFQDMSFGYWGGEKSEGALWVATGECENTRMELRDPWLALTGKSDSDDDAIQDLVDSDDDGDGVADLDDFAPLDPFTRFDKDGDGVGDYQDTDDDGDGMSDNYAGLPAPTLQPLPELDATGATALEVTPLGSPLLLKGGQLVFLDWSGNVLSTEASPLPEADSVAVGAAETAFHDPQARGVARTIQGQPSLWSDSPEATLDLHPLHADLAMSGSLLWLGISETDRLYLIDRSGNIDMEVRLPAPFRGVAAQGDTLWVLLAQSGTSSVLLHLDQAGNLLGHFTLPLAGLEELAAVAVEPLRLLAFSVQGGSTSVVEIGLPAGYQGKEPKPVPLSMLKLNDAALLSLYVPVSTANDMVSVSWPGSELTAADSFKVCFLCSVPGGYIPPQNCAEADPANGEALVKGLPDKMHCVFETRTTTKYGTATSRRVSIYVNQPGTGGIVLPETGKNLVNAWRLTSVPFLLNLLE